MEVKIVTLQRLENSNINQDAFWSNFCQELASNFGSEIFDKWFAKLNLQDLQSQELTISTPSKFLRDWLKREYLNKNLGNISNITQIAKKINPDLKKVSIIFDESVQKEEEKLEILKNETRDNVVSISKYDNVFSLGIDLNPQFTFENFVVGPCNKLACSIAKVIAKLEESLFCERDINPLFLYGGVGLGKTHLAQAVAWHIKEHDKKSKVVYLSAERFMHHFVKSLRDKKISDFKEKIRSIDILIIDDLQFIAGKDGTQEELLNSLNSLIENNKKIILVCDKSPGDMENISTKLKSKMSSGFVADFKCPSYETRLAILQKKAQNFDFEIKDEILELIANKINSSVRDLEGALKKIAANYIFTGQEINKQNVKDLLKDLFRTNHNETTIEKIQKITAKYFDVKISDLKSNSRLREFARPRQIAMYLAKNLTSKNLPEIGKEFGGKNHATVIHAIKKVEDLIMQNPKFSNNIKILEEKISG